MSKKLFLFLYDNFYDKRFEKNKLQYCLQCLIAVLAVFSALMTLNLVSNDLVVASIASTTFVVFTMPHKSRSRVRYVLGGYIIGFLLGMLSYFLSLFFVDTFPIIKNYYDEIFGAIAVGSSIFFMVILNLEHPPASAVSLGMVLNQWNKWTITVTIISITIILLSRHLLRNRLIDLL